ncbi:hemagglutinin-like protein [Paraburkholderia unamae]|uniref:Hemagglutinin-like protein n=1 Tax=Paraburkholderia unamae TaxID=219649 RepID=A0ABX5KN57_9BURK|nr:hemagglutinin-like protein [Paraburkholderia unamae]CAG9267570.1 hypothetical protein PUN4_540043 [Paraburkholderia unamae]
MTIAGSNVSANDVLLAARNQVNVVNTTNTDSTRSSNSSNSASVGVSVGTNGFGVSAAMSNAHGDANSDAQIQNASHVNGTNSVTVISGGDTNITGSQVNGGKVVADVGGNLNMASVQDVTTSVAHQSSAGGGFNISQAGGSASFSAQNGHADANYAGVNEQAGINAGSGGFDINVKGNTGLTGAVISSTADASKNSLTTGTLTYSDIQNQSHYDANSNGISAGVGVGNTGKATGPGSVSGQPGVSPMISQNENGDSSATTRSAISAGTINVTDGAHQTQDVASLSRDTTGTNGTVANTPDVNDLINKQADTMQAAQAAGQVVAQGIGAYADHKRDTATDQATYDAWDEGGANRTLAHIAGGALIGGLGGGALDAVGGAVGAGAASAMANQLDALSKGVTSTTGSELIGNLAANVAAGLGGAMVGGTAGAATGSAVQQYNQGMDNRKKKDLVTQACGAGAQCSDATLNAAIGAQGTIANAASDNMKAQAPYIAGTLVLGFLGPDALVAAATAGSLDFAADVSNYMTGLSTDKPNFGKSYATGLVLGSFGPLAIGDETIGGLSKGGIVAAGSYNAMVNATSAFGSAAVTNGSPDLSAGVAAGTTFAGYVAQAMIPGPAGAWANKTIQNSGGIIQGVIQKK